MCGAHTHQKLGTREMYDETIKKIVDHNPSAPINVEKETEEKVAFVVFQQSPIGVSPIEMISTLPQ